MQHRNLLERLAHDESMRQKSAESEHELAHLGAMGSLGVDLTTCLIAQHQHPDPIIRIEGDRAGQVRVHEGN